MVAYYFLCQFIAHNVLQVNDVLNFAKKRVSRASKIQNVAQPEAPKARSVYLLLYEGRIFFNFYFSKHDVLKNSYFHFSQHYFSIKFVCFFFILLFFIFILCLNTKNTHSNFKIATFYLKSKSQMNT